MSTQEFERADRLPAPRIPGGEIELQAPPEVPRQVSGGLLQKLMPVVMVVAMLGMVALMVASGGMSNPMTLLFPLMMVFSMLGMVAGNAGGKSKSPAELDEERKDYFRYLDGLRSEVAATKRAQRAGLVWDHPEPGTLAGLVGGARMWERTPAHRDFLHVRIATADQRLATALAVPALGPLEDLEPICAVAMRRFVHTHSVVEALPTAVSLRGFASITIGGDRDGARAAVRAMLLQLCLFHGPDHVRLCVVTQDPDGPEWGWIKWLPHARPPAGAGTRDGAGARDDPGTRDDPGARGAPGRRGGSRGQGGAERPGDGTRPSGTGVGSPAAVFGSLHALEETLSAELDDRGRFSATAEPAAGRRHLVLVLDGGHIGGDERIFVSGGIDGVSVLDLTGGFEDVSARRGMRCEVRAGRIVGLAHSGAEDLGEVDAIGVAEAEATARGLAQYRPAAAGASGRRTPDAGNGLMSLLGIGDAHTLSPEAAWRRRTGRDRLRVPIGVDQDGAPVELDLKEAAEGGMGPHGLCIGATGSGKSELLRTLVLSLIATHAPEQLNLVLVDFKGGATFLDLDRSHHVAAVITNLEDEIAMVDRMRDALAGEMHRRQELLRSAGNFANVGEYEAARVAGAVDGEGVGLAPLPALFIVVDEFSELLSAKPEFAELFAAIGRLGRSLHMHLLLASQRLEEGRLRGLDSHLSYRIGLKTFSGGESRSVLGVPDAYHLPPTPGSGYLKCDSGELVRFRSAYVSGPAPRPVRDVADVAHAERAWAMPFTAVAQTPPQVALGAIPLSDGVDAEAMPDGAATSLLRVVVDRLGTSGTPAHEVWLPPLDASPTLGELLEAQAAGPGDSPGSAAPDTPGRSGGSDDPVRPGGAECSGGTESMECTQGAEDLGETELRVPVGVVDRPFEQRRDVLSVRLTGAGGNAAIVGGPQSGKSTAARTLILGLAARNTPRLVQIYVLDFGGGGMVALADLPHVGSVAGRMAPDRVRRTIAELAGIIDAREEEFERLGIESMERFRTMRRQRTGVNGAAGGQRSGRGAGPGGESDTEPPATGADAAGFYEQFGDVFLVIDGFGAVREQFEELEPRIQELAVRGLSYGVHVVITAGRWAQVRPALKDMIGTRIELRLGDPADSQMDRRRAAQVPEGRPGRGLTSGGLHMLVALPRFASAGSDRAVEEIRTLWPGSRAPAVRMLPARLDLADLNRMVGKTVGLMRAEGPARTDDAGDDRPGGDATDAVALSRGALGSIPIGIDEAGLAPVCAELASQPHFMVFADPESGKTTLLRSLCRGILAARAAEDVKLLIADYRRTLLGEITGEHLAGYATTPDTLSAMVADLCRVLAERLPGPDVTQAQLRDKSWWSGPEIVVVVDDYDLVATASGNPLAPLADYLPQAKDIGFHLVVARRTGGAARALFDPVLGKLRELSTDGIVMNGGRDEGPVIGSVRPDRHPPGRGMLVSRSGGARLVQVAACEARS